MGKFWLKTVDPNKQCCGCEGKSGPCSSCCAFIVNSNSFNSEQEAKDYLKSVTLNCKLFLSGVDKSRLSLVDNRSTGSIAGPFPVQSKIFFGSSNNKNNLLTLIINVSGETIKQNISDFSIDCERKVAIVKKSSPQYSTTDVNFKLKTGSYETVSDETINISDPGSGVDIVPLSRFEKKMGRRYFIGKKYVFYRWSAEEETYDLLNPIESFSWREISKDFYEKIRDLETLTAEDFFNSGSSSFSFENGFVSASFTMEERDVFDGLIIIPPSPENPEGSVELKIVKRLFIDYSITTTNTNFFTGIDGSLLIRKTTGESVFTAKVAAKPGETNSISGTTIIDSSIKCFDLIYSVGLGYFFSFVGYPIGESDPQYLITPSLFCECFGLPDDDGEDVISTPSIPVDAVCVSFQQSESIEEFTIESLCPEERLEVNNLLYTNDGVLFFKVIDLDAEYYLVPEGARGQSTPKFINQRRTVVIKASENLCVYPSVGVASSTEAVSETFLNISVIGEAESKQFVNAATYHSANNKKILTICN